MQNDELAEQLDALQREECYRVDSVLKESAAEVTQRVYFMGANGAEQGPFVRKYIEGGCGLGAAYERIFAAQRQGRRFRFVPRIFDCYRLGEKLVVVMEFVDGETLADAVYRRDPSLELAREVFPLLCDAVSELHEAFDPPLIHRDLKPSNIMVSPGGVTIIDFGIARAYRDDGEADTARFGTRAYAPPEQFGYAQTSVRSDVYALGMLLYYCLAEKTPDARLVQGGFAEACVPAMLRPVLVRATAFDPRERYASARELKEAFLEAAPAGAARPRSRRLLRLRLRLCSRLGLRCRSRCQRPNLRSLRNLHQRPNLRRPSRQRCRSSRFPRPNPCSSLRLRTALSLHPRPSPNPLPLPHRRAAFSACLCGWASCGMSYSCSCGSRFSLPPT